jgi:hypothetical protein
VLHAGVELIAVVIVVAVSVLIFITPFLKSDYGRKSRITVYIPRIMYPRKLKKAASPKPARVLCERTNTKSSGVI